MQFKTEKYYLSLPISAITKTIFLFITALILVNLKVLPAIFMTTMGLFQLYTALIGGVAALAVIETRKRIVKG